MKVCKRCKNKFEPIFRNGIPLSAYCNPCLNEIRKEKLKITKKGAFVQGMKVGNGLKFKRGDYSARPVNWLIEKATEQFNKFIRNRDAINGYFFCGACNTRKKIEGDNYHACHLFPAGNYPALRFNEDNVHGGCKSCNYFKHGSTHTFEDWVRGKIGTDRFEKLLEIKNLKRKWKWNKEELIRIINYYKDKNDNWTES